MRAISRLDRRFGRALRRAARAVPGCLGVAGALAAAMSPAFRVAVAALIVRRSSRRTGLEALAAGVGAALAARALRDRLGRRRPGARTEGGFPSRHAAAAAAIAGSVARHDRRIGTALAVAAGLGGAARVATAEHEPGDIAAGIALGVATAWSLAVLAETGGRLP